VALRYYKKAAETANHKDAYSRCADFYYSWGNKKSAMALYKKAAEYGDVGALNNIGLMLENGYDDIPPSIDAAIKKYKEAHLKGDRNATINLGIYYLNVSLNFAFKTPRLI
jgi:TPR repeat protein